MEFSPLHQQRSRYQPKLPPAIAGDVSRIVAEQDQATDALSDQQALKELFQHSYGQPSIRFTPGNNPNATKKRNVGVILSGGQAPGGHNVIAGIFDSVREANPESQVHGFLGGPGGLLAGSSVELTPEFVDEYRNTGGFDMIGSGRTKVETEEQFETALSVCRKMQIDALVIIGGDDSNTNAALLDEYFRKQEADVCVIGVPKTIDGDLKGDSIEASFGFDTATKTYSELIGNIARDATSAKKYWHFIKVMGRSASHIALECALQTRPNVCLIGEEVAEKNQTLDQIAEHVTDAVAERASNGESFGVAIVPEGLIEFIPEMKTLIGELNSLLAGKEAPADPKSVASKLSPESATAFQSLPDSIQEQLLMDRDPHGNVQVSRIETEKLLLRMVEEKVKERKEAGRFSGKFSGLCHFFGYEGRCAYPSNFDADYSYSLGRTAFLLAANELSGYIVSVTNLAQPSDKWEAGGVPLTSMMNMETRKGEQTPVIRKALVDLEDKPFQAFAGDRGTWQVQTRYRYPGAIQYYGPDEVCNRPTETLRLEAR